MKLKYEIESEVNHEVYGQNPKDAIEDWKRAVEYALTHDLNQWGYNHCNACVYNVTI